MKVRRYILGILIATGIVSLAFAVGEHSLQTQTGAVILYPGSNHNVRIQSTARIVSVLNLAGNGVPAGVVPLGGLIPVIPSTHANAWTPPASGVIKDGFMRADGTLISAGNVSAGCVLPQGTALPDMTLRYMKGNSASGTVLATTFNSLTISSNTALPTISTTNATTNTSSAHTHSMAHGHSTSGTQSAQHNHTANSHNHAGNWYTAAANANHTHSGTSTSGGSHYHNANLGFTDSIGTWWNSGSPAANRLFSPDAIWSACYGSAGNTCWTTYATSPYHLHDSVAAPTNSYSASGVHSSTIGSSSTTSWDASDASGAHTHPLGASSISTSGASTPAHYHKTSYSIGQASPTSLDIQPAHLDAVWVIRVL